MLFRTCEFEDGEFEFFNSKVCQEIPEMTNGCGFEMPTIYTRSQDSPFLFSSAPSLCEPDDKNILVAAKTVRKLVRALR